MKKLISLLPSRAWHIIFCFIATFVSIWLAIGLALGRESTNITKFDDKPLMKDTYCDLIADGVGIGIVMIINLLV